MARWVRFEKDVEALVSFVEETSPETIVEETVAKLQENGSEDSLMLALALATIRSTESCLAL